MAISTGFGQQSQPQPNTFGQPQQPQAPPASGFGKRILLYPSDNDSSRFFQLQARSINRKILLLLSDNLRIALVLSAPPQARQPRSLAPDLVPLVPTQVPTQDPRHSVVLTHLELRDLHRRLAALLRRRPPIFLVLRRLLLVS